MSVMFGACQPPASAGAPATSPITGVVVHVESTGLNQVTSFDLRTTDGEVYTFELSRLEPDSQFPPGHLTEHQAGAEPIRVHFTVDGQTIFAARLEDASG